MVMVNEPVTSCTLPENDEANDDSELHCGRLLGIILDGGRSGPNLDPAYNLGFALVGGFSGCDYGFDDSFIRILPVLFPSVFGWLLRETGSEP